MVRGSPDLGVQYTSTEELDNRGCCAPIGAGWFVPAQILPVVLFTMHTIIRVQVLQLDTSFRPLPIVPTSFRPADLSPSHRSQESNSLQDSSYPSHTSVPAAASGTARANAAKDEPERDPNCGRGSRCRDRRYAIGQCCHVHGSMCQAFSEPLHGMTLPFVRRHIGVEEFLGCRHWCEGKERTLDQCECCKHLGGYRRIANACQYG